MKLSSVFERLVLSHARDLAPACKTGRPRALDDQTTLDRIFKLLRTGCQLRELDCAGASHMAVRRRMRLWEDKGVFEKAYQRALETYTRLKPPKRHLLDSSHIRNRHGRRPDTGRNHTDRGRQGCKVSIVTDECRVVYGLRFDPSNRPDVVLLDAALDSRWIKLDGIELWADRGYDSRANRTRCEERKVRDRIFRRRTKTTRKSNAKRVVVEHVFAHLQAFRRLSFCYEQRNAVLRNLFILAFGHRIGIQITRLSDYPGHPAYQKADQRVACHGGR